MREVSEPRQSRHRAALLHFWMRLVGDSVEHDLLVFAGD